MIHQRLRVVPPIPELNMHALLVPRKEGGDHDFFFIGRKRDQDHARNNTKDHQYHYMCTHELRLALRFVYERTLGDVLGKTFSQYNIFSQ
jgi:hypothetical protein